MRHMLTGRLYIVLPIPSLIANLNNLTEVLFWLRGVLVWLTQARVYKFTVCICRTQILPPLGVTKLSIRTRNERLQSIYPHRGYYVMTIPQASGPVQTSNFSCMNFKGFDQNGCYGNQPQSFKVVFYRVSADTSYSFIKHDLTVN